MRSLDTRCFFAVLYVSVLQAWYLEPLRKAASKTVLARRTHCPQRSFFLRSMSLFSLVHISVCRHCSLRNFRRTATVVPRLFPAPTPSSESQFANLHNTIDDILFWTWTCPHTRFDHAPNSHAQMCTASVCRLYSSSVFHTVDAPSLGPNPRSLVAIRVALLALPLLSELSLYRSLLLPVLFVCPMASTEATETSKLEALLSNFTLSMKKFDGSNYSTWASDILLWISGQELCEYCTWFRVCKLVIQFSLTAGT